jgi:hypothetical protein
MSNRSSLSASRLRARPRIEVLEDRTLPSIFTVTNIKDSGPGSLRDAIEKVNQDTSPDVIKFNIPFAARSSSATGLLFIIPLTSPLPTLTDQRHGRVRGIHRSQLRNDSLSHDQQPSIRQRL